MWDSGLRSATGGLMSASAPVAPNPPNPPIVSVAGGGSATSNVNKTVTASVTDGTGTAPYQYRWTVVNAPERVVITNQTSAAATFKPVTSGTYVLQCLVTDDDDDLGWAEVTVTVP